MSGVDLASGFWFLGSFQAVLGSPMADAPTPSQAARGLRLREAAPPETGVDGRTLTQAPRMASGLRLPDARMRVVSLGEGATRVRIAVSGLPRARWRVQSADGFGSGSWRDDGILQLDAEGEGVLETGGRDESAVRFYRLVQP